MTLLLRSARDADVAACVEILEAWAAETPWMVGLDDRPALLAFWCDLFARDRVWVAERDGRVVGFCTRDDDNIGALYVASGARGAGIGKRLLDAAKADCDRITVWAYALNADARRFYRREGLVELSREVEDGSGLLNVEHRWVGAG